MHRDWPGLVGRGPALPDALSHTQSELNPGMSASATWDCFARRTEELSCVVGEGLEDIESSVGSVESLGSVEAVSLVGGVETWSSVVGPVESVAPESSELSQALIVPATVRVRARTTAAARRRGRLIAGLLGSRSGAVSVVELVETGAGAMLG
jgi:hypothetical protein